jgi:hypothetical protein
VVISAPRLSTANFCFVRICHQSNKARQVFGGLFYILY